MQVLRFFWLFFLVLISCRVFGGFVLAEKTLAIVNSEIVLLSDLTSLREKTKTPTLIDESLIPESTSDKLSKLEPLKSNREVQIRYLINEEIVDSEIKRLNLTVTMDRADLEIKDIAKRNGVSYEELLRAVKSEGISTADYQNFIKTRIERQNLIESEIVSKIRITDEEALSEYLRANKEGKALGVEYSLAHIFFNPKKGGSEAALLRAKNVLDKLTGGEAFELLAEQNSEDKNFASGGLWGSFKSGELLPEMETALQSRKVGEYTGPLQSKAGYHIVKILEKKVVSDSGFEKEKDRIKSRLLEANMKRQFKIWLQSRYEEASIRINE